jgi:hypothetical protein
MMNIGLCPMTSYRHQGRTKGERATMSFQKVPMSEFFREVYSRSQRYLGSIYLYSSARKWAIKEYPGQWFETEEMARGWLINKDQPVSKG